MRVLLPDILRKMTKSNIKMLIITPAQSFLEMIGPSELLASLTKHILNDLKAARRLSRLLTFDQPRGNREKGANPMKLLRVKILSEFYAFSRNQSFENSIKHLNLRDSEDQY